MGKVGLGWSRIGGIKTVSIRSIFQMNGNKYWRWARHPTTQTSVQPHSREGHSLVYCPSIHSLVMFGGRSTTHTNDLFVYSLHTSRWTRPKCTGNSPSPLSYHSSIAVENLVLNVGGLKETGISTSEIFVLEVKTWKWMSMKCYERFLPRHSSSICYANGKVAIFGGTQKPELRSLNDLWTIELSDLRFEQKEIKFESCPSRGTAPERRHGHLSFGTRESLFVTWGMLESGNIDHNVYCYSFLKQEWLSIQPHGLQVKPRLFSSCAKISDQEVIIFGGSEIENQKMAIEVYTFNFGSNLFSLPFLAFSQPEGRKCQASCKAEDKIFVVGGLNSQYCSMDLHCLQQIPYANNEVWLKNKQLSHKQKVALNILKRQVVTNYQQISNVQKLIREENHQALTLEILYSTLDDKRSREIQRIHDINSEEKGKIDENRQMIEEYEKKCKDEIEWIGMEREWQEVLKETIAVQELFVLNLINLLGEIDEENVDVDYRQQKKRFEQQLSKIEEFDKMVEVCRR